ncbi:hypothetical protein A2Y99_01780 [Candidatus Gottesmanbacteria bacterium RBG_13_37_7]|uniref:tRNA (N(6)-L-threonylcarbamoyladenosine(37)-C(2))-methylthiotransferase n=1 Tax=Candidatus Gottesmanbacteria bacterium RBG_13_37_7 TaxID=1798369 RepID=A0A1F5YI78_9BACT|nr:MAG: hypothetical protein A2Y99_01780 [Candidatus Gottesmanbacteria bacterium RBG_13_37_7]
MKTFATYSFGCRVNQAEIQEISNQLSVLGFQYSEKNPEFYIINTCAVTRKAEREARQFIYQIRKKYPKTQIIITGCVATKWKMEKSQFLNSCLRRQAKSKISTNDLPAQTGKIQRKNILFIDNKVKENIVRLINSNYLHAGDATPTKSGKRQSACADRDPQINIFSFGKYLPSKRLLIKIQDGCHRFCTYCIVPYLRGKPKSERIRNIELRIKNFEDKIKEVILTAINTEAYGLDTGESFIDLIKTILEKTNIERLSFGSINPWSIDDKFLNFYEQQITDNRFTHQSPNEGGQLTADNRLAHFFHIPLQSGSNKILSLMKRDYTKKEFLEKIKAIKKINQLAFIATDVIVGFPGEKEEDFQDTYNFLRDSPIVKFHVFRFSKREFTAAYYMSKKLKESSEDVKKKRAQTLIDMGRKKYHQFLNKHIGKTFPALFLTTRKNGSREALLDNQIPVLVKTDKNLAGEIRRVKVIKRKENLLFAKFC